jgi:hypothetical protein
MGAPPLRVMNRREGETRVFAASYRERGGEAILHENGGETVAWLQTEAARVAIGPGIILSE